MHAYLHAYSSYCPGLLSKYKHYTFQCTAPLPCNIKEGALQNLLLVVYARISFSFLKNFSEYITVLSSKENPEHRKQN